MGGGPSLVLYVVDSYKQLGPPYRVPSTDTRSAHDGARSATYYSAGLRVRLPPARATPGATSLRPQPRPPSDRRLPVRRHARLNVEQPSRTLVARGRQLQQHARVTPHGRARDRPRVVHEERDRPPAVIVVRRLAVARLRRHRRQLLEEAQRRLVDAAVDLGDKQPERHLVYFFVTDHESRVRVIKHLKYYVRRMKSTL